MTAVEYLIILLKNALEGKRAPMPEQSVDFDALLTAAKAHSVANIVYYALPPEFGHNKAEYAKEYSKAVKKDAIQKIELSAITKALENAGIEALLGKGVVIKPLYPSADMRTMSDLDILIKKTDAEAIASIMKSIGYEFSEGGDNNHLCFNKKPVMNVEFHTSLFSDKHKRFECYNDGWQYASKTDGCIKKMTPEGEYIYSIAHFAKHFLSRGAGIRPVMDVFVYRKAFEGKLDFDYINKELQKASLCGLEQELFGLSKAWFGGETATKLQNRMGAYIVEGGVYGTSQNEALMKAGLSGSKQQAVKNEISKRKVFPPLSVLRQKHPILQKHGCLLPFVWIWRLVKAPFTYKKVTRQITSAKASRAETQDMMLRELGLK